MWSRVCQGLLNSLMSNFGKTSDYLLQSSSLIPQSLQSKSGVEFLKSFFISSVFRQTTGYCNCADGHGRFGKFDLVIDRLFAIEISASQVEFFILVFAKNIPDNI